MSATTAVQAHRGSPDHNSDVRENTLAAFARARDLGADGVELDVRLTADGALAVHHDAVVAGAGAVHELTAAELPSYVPLLADALDVCDGLRVNIEVKNLPHESSFDPTDRCARDVVDLVVAAGRTGSVVVSSFWGGALATVRDAGADVATGLLVVSSFDVDGAVGGAIDLGCSALHLPVGLVTPGAVVAAHDAGLEVAAWTVADVGVLVDVLGAGVDTVITDDVALCRQVIDPA